MALWTTPIVVSGQHTFNAPAFGKVSGVLDVNDLDLINYRIWTKIDHNVVRLDVENG